MPTIKYSNNPNEETAFVTTEDDTRTRVVLTTPVDGTVKFPDNPNSTKVSVTVDGVARKAVAVYNLGGGGGGGDQHNLGWYATESALTTAHATASDGDFAILGSTDTVWVWDSDTSAWKDTDTKGQVTSVNGQTGAVTVDTLPDQTGHSGEFLTTDGTDASWSDKPLVNTATGTNSLAIKSDTTTASDAVSIGVLAKVRDGAYGQAGIAIGYKAKANWQYGLAIGTEAVGSGISIGHDAQTTVSTHTIAIGNSTRASAVQAIQIGSNAGNYTTNSDANTMKVANANGNFEMMSADGTIPAARHASLPAADGTYTLQLVIADGVPTLSWVAV